jgi:hypothetical protein
LLPGTRTAFSPAKQPNFDFLALQQSIKKQRLRFFSPLQSHSEENLNRCFGAVVRA